MFAHYAVQLAFRAALFAVAVYLFAAHPDQLDARRYFGLPGGFNAVDFIFLAMLSDFLTKFLVHARISAGSLKQYGMYQIPTPLTATGGREGLREQFDEIAALGQQLAESGRTALAETIEGLAVQSGSLMSFTRRLLNNVDFLRLFSFDERDLAIDTSLHATLYRDRRREIVPVIVLWVAGNAVIALALLRLGVLDERTALLWSLFYFMFDMICVVLWCPLQLLLMHNRCCTTCQIFNWDAIMVATPLIFVGGWFGGILLACAVIILIRWELAAVRHPERFDERTNARLACAQCPDKLCYLRGPLTQGIRNKDIRALLRVSDADGRASDAARDGGCAPEEAPRPRAS